MSARGAGLTTVLAGTLIDGSGHDPRHHVQITITGDTITSITDGHDVPAGSSVFDARHLTVMPGLIDSHVHLAMVPKGL